jgi:hypothetical protein
MGGLDSTDGLVEHLRVTCIGGHSTVQLADRIKHLSPLAPHRLARSAPLANAMRP